jgi:hypothetical protein
MAVDVGVVAPHNLHAMRCTTDPLDEYRGRKINKSAGGCRAAGWSFYPFLVSAHGRVHPQAARLVHRLCVRAAREFVVEPVKRLETNWWRNATTILMQRNAAMVERCRPVPDVASGIDGCREDRRGVEPHRPLRRNFFPNTLAPSVIGGASAPAIPSE